MTNLRERVAAAMWDDSREYYMRVADIGPWKEADPPTVDFSLRQADAAIEAVFNALLSDACVEAAMDVMGRPITDEDGWNIPYGRRYNRYEFKVAQKAAQAALTGAEEGERDD